MKFGIATAVALIISGVAGAADPVAYFRECPIYLENLSSQMQGFSATDDPAGYAAALQAAVTGYASQLLLDEEFKRSGIVANAEIAQKYADAMPQKLRSQLLDFVKDPNFQRKCAISAWLATKFPPEKLLPDEQEISDYYYANQRRFRTESENEIGIITIDRKRPDAAEIAATVRDRLLQGESFDKLGREFDPGAARSALSDADQEKLNLWCATHDVGEISDIVETDRGFVLLKLKARRPARLLPLADVEPFIREDLRAAKEAAALAEYFRRELPRLVHMVTP